MAVNRDDEFKPWNREIVFMHTGGQRMGNVPVRRKTLRDNVAKGAFPNDAAVVRENAAIVVDKAIDKMMSG